MQPEEGDVPDPTDLVPTAPPHGYQSSDSGRDTPPSQPHQRCLHSTRCAEDSWVQLSASSPPQPPEPDTGAPTPLVWHCRLSPSQPDIPLDKQEAWGSLDCDLAESSKHEASASVPVRELFKRQTPPPQPEHRATESLGLTD